MPAVPAPTSFSPAAACPEVAPQPGPAVSFPELSHEYALPPLEFSFLGEDQDLDFQCQAVWIPDQMGFDLDLYGALNSE
jgi:hypothetical protein